MAEKELFLPSIDPIEFFGPNNVKFKFVQSKFPKLKIMTRGNMLKAVGSDDELQRLDDFLTLIFWHIEKYQSLSLQQLERMAIGESSAQIGRAHV